MMALIDDKALKIQGRVNYTLLEKFTRKSLKANNDSDWFFIDYSPFDFQLKSNFDLFFSSHNKSIFKSDSTILIKEVYDSFGNLLEEGIPKGYKTVCELAFTNGIPKEFQELPLLKGWKSSPAEILITSIGNIEFNVFPELLNDLIKIINLICRRTILLIPKSLIKRNFLKD